MPPPFDPHDDENWIGGYYEAAMVIGSVDAPQSDALLRAALDQLWLQDALQAFAIGEAATWRWSEPSTLGDRALADLQRVYGVFHHRQLGALPFTSVIVREEMPDGQDWLYACVPLGGLAQSDGYPFGGKRHTAASKSWRAPLEQELASLVLAVCEAAPIQIAAIGFEVSGVINRGANQVAETPRHVGYVAPDGDGYRYWPTTDW